MAADDFLLIGKIVGMHGVRGMLKLRSFTETDTFFQPGTTITLAAANGERTDYRITAAKPHKRNLLILLEGAEDAQKAQMLVGMEVVARRSEFPELEADTYYWSDLIGITVFSVEGALLGRIESIFPTGSNDVLVVKQDGVPGETLVPALASVITEVDLDAKIMRVDLPEGLS